MKGHARDYVFWSAIAAISLLHVDLWAWNKIHPVLFGWIPYHLWYDGILTLVSAAFFCWWGVKMWPDASDDFDR